METDWSYLWVEIWTVATVENRHLVAASFDKPAPNYRTGGSGNNALKFAISFIDSAGN